MTDVGKQWAEVLREAIRHPLRGLCGVACCVLIILAWIIGKMAEWLEESAWYLGRLSHRFEGWIIERVP